VLGPGQAVVSRDADDLVALECDDSFVAVMVDDGHAQERRPRHARERREESVPDALD